MKKKLHYILIVANFISLMFILQIVFGVIPLIECPLNQLRIDLINNLVVDVSIGIILSSLFYYLLVYIPESKKQRIIRQINYSNLQFIADWMQLIIGYVSERCSLKVKGDFYEKIDTPEFEKVSGIHIGDGVNDISYRKIFSHYDMAFNNYIDTINLQIYKEKTIKFIDEISSSPNIIYEEEDLVYLLDRIKKSIFFIYIDEIEYQVKNKIFDYTPFKVEAVRDLHELYASLLKYVTPHKIEFIKI